MKYRRDLSIGTLEDTDLDTTLRISATDTPGKLVVWKSTPSTSHLRVPHLPQPLRLLPRPRRRAHAAGTQQRQGNRLYRLARRRRKTHQARMPGSAGNLEKVDNQWRDPSAAPPEATPPPSNPPNVTSIRELAEDVRALLCARQIPSSLTA